MALMAGRSASSARRMMVAGGMLVLLRCDDDHAVALQIKRVAVAVVASDGGEANLTQPIGKLGVGEEADEEVEAAFATVAQDDALGIVAAGENVEAAAVEHVIALALNDIGMLVCLQDVVAVVELDEEAPTAL